MQPFERYFRDKMTDARFKALYDRECHVCAKTLQIFETADRKGLSTASLAGAVEADASEVEALREADRCDPRMVMRLCRHLGLHPPAACPRLGEAGTIPSTADP